MLSGLANLTILRYHRESSSETPRPRCFSSGGSNSLLFRGLEASLTVILAQNILDVHLTGRESFRSAVSRLRNRRQTAKESRAIPADERNEPNSIPHANKCRSRTARRAQNRGSMWPCSPGHHFAPNGSPICGFCNKLVTSFGAVDRGSPKRGTEDHGSITPAGLP